MGRRTHILLLVFALAIAGALAYGTWIYVENLLYL
jgi:hypothetical protein